MKERVRMKQHAVRISFPVMMICFVIGCSETPTAGPEANPKTKKEGPVDPGPPPGGQSEPEKSPITLPLPGPGKTSQLPDSSTSLPGQTRSPFTHVIAQKVDYYKAGPQQAVPPDGKLFPGTQVNIVRKAGSYTEIETEDGIRAYVASESLRLAEKNERTLK